MTLGTACQNDSLYGLMSNLSLSATFVNRCLRMVLTEREKASEMQRSAETFFYNERPRVAPDRRMVRTPVSPSSIAPKKTAKNPEKNNQRKYETICENSSLCCPLEARGQREAISKSFLESFIMDFCQKSLLIRHRLEYSLFSIFESLFKEIRAGL